MATYLSLGLHKGRPSYRRSLQPSKEYIQHFKTWKFRTFFYFVGPDPDPETQINADPEPQPCIFPYILCAHLAESHMVADPDWFAFPWRIWICVKTYCILSLISCFASTSFIVLYILDTYKKTCWPTIFPRALIFVHFDLAFEKPGTMWPNSTGT